MDGGRCVPRFSPNGKKIVFLSDRDGYKELYVMNADGSAQERLFKPANDDRNTSAMK